MWQNRSNTSYQGSDLQLEQGQVAWRVLRRPIRNKSRIVLTRMISNSETCFLIGTMLVGSIVPFILSCNRCQPNEKNRQSPTAQNLCSQIHTQNLLDCKAMKNNVGKTYLNKLENQIENTFLEHF